MNPSPPSVSPEEQEQLLQTIEMFEVIVQANPMDTQSIEILRDAYGRLGMRKEMIGMARGLAQTFSELKQYASAIQEYELILKHEPDNVEVIAAMGEVEERMHKSGRPRPSPKQTGIDLDFRAAVADTGTLMATATTQRAEGLRQGKERIEEIAATLVEDGNEALAKFLVQHRLATEDAVTVAMDMVQRKNQAAGPEGLAASLIEEIVERGGGDMETILSGILDRTKFAYVPLEYYDVDRQVAKMLPENIALNRLIVPFDMMSRTVMVATANPFDSIGKNAAQQLLDYNIQWHLASPTALIRVLQQAFRISQSAPAVVMPFATVPVERAPIVPAEVPVPAAIKVGANGAPLAPANDGPAAPLPDTSAFRLAKK
jgi:tetratricopeptide (TPR) repeat protein